MAYPANMWRHISLSTAERRATVVPFPPEMSAPFGRGLASMLLATHLEYDFVIANSLLAGTKIPLLTHVSMGARVPLQPLENPLDIPVLKTPTPAIKLSNTGGLVGFRMASMGIGSISLEAHETPAPMVAALLPDGCRFEDADGLEDLSPALAAAFLHRRFGNNCTILLAGPAARRGYAMAQLMISDHPDRELRLTGRGGPAVALARSGVSALVVGGKEERAPWRGMPGAGECVAAFMHTAAALFQENSGVASDDMRSTTGDNVNIPPKEPDGGSIVPCSSRRTDCKNRCPLGRLRRDTLSGPTKALPDKPPFPGSPEEAATFAQDCNRLGIDAHDAVRTLGMALSMNLVLSPREFLRHLEDASPLGRRLGQGSGLFAARLLPPDHEPTAGKKKNAGRHSLTKEEKERLAALDCLGLCAAASRMLTTVEGRGTLLRLLDMTAPGEPWSEERILRLGRNTLEQEAGLARKDHPDEAPENAYREKT